MTNIDRLSTLPRTRPPGYWAVNFTDAQLRRALDPEPTEADELLRIELERRAKLPVVANPRIEELPTVALRGWAHHFDALAYAAPNFDELYPATRAYGDVADELARRDTALRATASTGDGHDDPVRLFDAWES